MESNERLLLHIADGLYRMSRDAQSRYDTAKTAEECAELRIIRKIATSSIPRLIETFVREDDQKWNFWEWYLKKTKKNNTVLPARSWWRRLLHIG